jgi:hypothetical protein
MISRRTLASLLFLSAFPVLLAGGCGKSNPISPGPGDGSVLIATGAPGPEGGVVGDSTAQLLIPAGALPAVTPIRIYASDARPFGANSVSRTYRIEGLSTACSRPLHFRLRYVGALSGTSYMALGTTREVSELGGSKLVHGLVAASDSGGFLVADIPALSGGDAARPSRGAGTAATDAVILSAGGASGFSLHNTAHFRVIYPVALAGSGAPDSIGRHLELAHGRLEAMGFSYASRTVWPVVAIVKYGMEAAKDGTVPYGYSTRTAPYDANSGFLVFDADRWARQEEMRVTAAHEWFHLVQDLYTSSAAYAWFADATAVWFEGKFVDRAGYVSAARAGQELTPLDGMQPGPGVDAGHHGYGMSAMIQHLVAVAGNDLWIAGVYRAGAAGVPPVEALIAQSPDPVLISWWSNFYVSYLQGGIYAVNPQMFLNTIVVPPARRFTVAGTTDTLKTFDAAYQDLSVKLHIVELKYAKLDSAAVLSLEVDGTGDAGVTVFKCRNGVVTHLGGYASKSLTVDNPRVLTDQGYNLLVAVTNRRHVAPYTGATPVRLTARMITPVATTQWFNLSQVQETSSTGVFEEPYVVGYWLPKLQLLLDAARLRQFNSDFLNPAASHEARIWLDTDLDGHVDDQVSLAKTYAGSFPSGLDINSDYTVTGTLARGRLTGASVQSSTGPSGSEPTYASRWTTVDASWNGSQLTGTFAFHSRYYSLNGTGVFHLQSEGVKTFSITGTR